MHRVDELLKRSLLQIDWRMNRFKDLYTVVLIGTVLLICFSVGELLNITIICYLSHS